MFNNSYVQSSYFNVQFIIYFILFSVLFIVKKIMKSVLVYGSFKAISLGHWLSATKKENRKRTADPTIFSLLSLGKQVKQRELSLRQN